MLRKSNMAFPLAGELVTLNDIGQRLFCVNLFHSIWWPWGQLDQ